MRIWYVGLEPYEDRYTLQLTNWVLADFRRLGVDYINVPGKQLTNKIETGVVLDACGRPYFAMHQIAWLLERLRNGQISSADWILFEDMFHPGIESLWYAFSQRTARPSVAMKCLAQTIDPDDFTHYKGMFPWMRRYEEMVLDSGYVDLLLFAVDEMRTYAAVAGWTSKVASATVGLSTSREAIRSMVGENNIKPFEARTRRVAFASRYTHEKQPEFFIKLSQQFHHTEFCFLSGGKLPISSNGNLKVYDNLSKRDYYALLNDTKLVFNSALQDWVSNTLLEASALGCNVLMPAYRAFPEVLQGDPRLMYVPWSMEDAIVKVIELLHKYNPASMQPAVYHSSTTDRIIAAMVNGVGVVSQTNSFVRRGKSL